MYITEELIRSVTQDYSALFPDREANFCASRDIFSARLDSFIRNSGKYLQGAIVGEIGNNTFDHNLDYRDGFQRGVYFNRDDADIIVLADYGSGIRNTLSRVLPNLTSDLEAIETAFTKIISGRAPEQRGNGLKFVLSNMVSNGWSMYCQSGTATCRCDSGLVSFHTTPTSVFGCLAILDFQGTGKEQVQ